MIASTVILKFGSYDQKHGFSSELLVESDFHRPNPHNQNSTIINITTTIININTTIIMRVVLLKRFCWLRYRGRS